MKINYRGHVLRIRLNGQPDYPWLGIVSVMLLIYLSPFTGSVTSFAAFCICLFRIVRYDAKVFATDYCLLIPLAQIFFAPGGISFLVFLCILSSVWFFIKGGIRANITFITLIILMDYLLMRMQTNITGFLLCFAQLCVLCVILPEQDQKSAERTAWYFCIGLIITSVYALVFRNTWQLRAILGEEDEAIWGSGIKRFYGLFMDPNYYMTLILVGLGLLAKLKNNNTIGVIQFVVLGIVMVFFGVLTYSKMFLLAFILFGVIYIIWRFRDRKYLFGFFLILGVLAMIDVLRRLEIGPVEVLLDRLRGASNLRDLTTGRTVIFQMYLTRITESVSTFLFGYGLSDAGLFVDTHNLYLELLYYLGFVGLVLVIAFFASIVYAINKKADKISVDNAISKYLILFLLIIVYCSLHGMTQMMFYGGVFLAILSILIVKDSTK